MRARAAIASAAEQNERMRANEPARRERTGDYAEHQGERNSEKDYVASDEREAQRRLITHLIVPVHRERREPADDDSHAAADHRYECGLEHHGEHHGPARDAEQ